MTWFAIRCAPQREIAVEAMLRRKGYDVFLPTEVKSKKIGKSPKKYKAVVYPMFTRYLFVAAPVPWLHLMAERHVTGVVGCDRDMNARMGRQARKTIEARYADDLAGQAFVDVWDRLLQKARQH